MPTQLTQISGKEFVEKILQDERDFSGIRLEPNFNLSGYEGFAEMQAYLKKQELSENPVIIDHSEFYHINAKGLYLPFVRGTGANLRGAFLQGASLQGAYLAEASLQNAYLPRADLWKAVLHGAFLQGANLQYTNLREVHLAGASLQGANLKKADLWKAFLRGADLRGANLQYTNLREVELEGANFWGADLRGARGLENALNLGLAFYQNTRVTRDQEAIIRRELSKKNLFVVES